jgi:DNA-binding transcriptional regulator GbsR (MarR family)
MTDGTGAGAGGGGAGGGGDSARRDIRDTRSTHEGADARARTVAAAPGLSSVTARVESSAPSHRPARDEEAVRRYVEQIAMQFADWGFPRMAGRVLFALMTVDEPGLTAVELGRRLDASAAAISGAVRFLGQLRIVVREPVPGSRRDLYRLADNAWYMAAVTELGLYQSIIDASGTVLDALGEDGSPAHARVAEMRDFFAFMQEEMAGLLAKWQSVRPTY